MFGERCALLAANALRQPFEEVAQHLIAARAVVLGAFFAEQRAQLRLEMRKSTAVKIWCMSVSFSSNATRSFFSTSYW